MKNRQKVFVGVSGGVDSSVSLALLKEQNYDVTGVFIKVWYPNWITGGCDWRAERRDAMRVCAHLNVPFETLDLEDVYKREVVDYMIQSYARGETPNPDVMCNRHVKFGAFWDFAKKEGADYIATGHYAQKKFLGSGYHLSISKDIEKDQTYFLWTLTQDDLAHVLFPIGHLRKSEVRLRAETYGLPTATKKDSQGLCFLGDISIKDLLSHYVHTEKGDVLNESGDIIGFHDGALYFTLGQRHGFTLKNKTTNSKPQYVIAKNMDENTITVSPYKYITGDIKKLVLRNCQIGNISAANTYTCRLRYRGSLLICHVEQHGETCSILFETNIAHEFPAYGQSVVLYDGDICVGGGIIDLIG